MSSIVLDVTDHVARITIDRPERMNAFDIDTKDSVMARDYDIVGVQVTKRVDDGKPAPR